jgi:hypothetical protein
MFDQDFVDGINAVGAKVFVDFKTIPKGKPLTEEQLKKFDEETKCFALPDTDDKTNQSQKMSADEIPDVLVQAYERH